MSFLIPQLLWALPAAALPLIIHLISRANTRVVDFSTLIFFDKMEHDSIRRLRWNQWLVILLRTLILLVLLLLLARPVVKGYFQGWMGDTASTLTVVVIDDSFSMSGEARRIGQGRRQGRAVAILTDLFENLADQGNRGQVVILRATDGRTLYNGTAANLPKVEELVSLFRPGYRQDNLQAILDSLSSPAFQDGARLYANREMVLISDFQVHQQGVLRQLGRDMTTWADWHFFLMPVTSQDQNLAVINANVETTIPLVGELMDVTVTVRNTGEEPQRNIPVQIVLNDVRSGQLVVDLNVGEQKTFTFQVAPTIPGHQQGYAAIERDQRPGDNRFYFHTFIPEEVRVLLVEPPDLDPSFPGLALGALASETPHIQFQEVSPADITWEPQNYNVIVLNSLPGVPRLLSRRLKAFMDGGGSLIVIPGPDPEHGQALGILIEQLDLPPVELTPQRLGSPLPLDNQVLESSLFSQAFARERDLDALPRTSLIYPVHPRGQDEMVLRVQGNYPLLIRTGSGTGTVFLFALPFNLQWTDMPIRGSFIPLWHRLIYWRPASSVLADVRVGDRPVLAVTPRQSTQSMTLTAPNKVTSLIIPDMRTRTVTLRNLQEPGVYALGPTENRQSKALQALGQGAKFRVNIPQEELTAGYLSPTALASLFGPDRAFILAAGGPVGEHIQQARFGRELWRPLLYLLIILLILEFILANVYNSPRRPIPAKPRG